MQTRKNRKAGFTLVEIMIVVAIIGLLAAIAIPNFIKARTTSQMNACINNLRQIDGAIQQWALENKKSGSDGVTAADVQPYMGRGTGELPVCPSAGPNGTFATSYIVSNVETKPVCNIVAATHKLP
jgi:prepilin-type N-terminal cleavage/methylation domain-containing protein